MTGNSDSTPGRKRSNQQRDMLSVTLTGLEAGLRVKHIATFDLFNCTLLDEASVVLERTSSDGFDQVPVEHDGHIIGVLERKPEIVSGPVKQWMRQLDDAILIPGDAPVARFIRLAAHSSYRLVVTDDGITGVVTRSDLIKLPVRIFAFTLVTHLESMIAAAIRAAYPNDDGWLQHLDKGGQDRVQAEWRRRRQQLLDPPLLECTTFYQKYNALVGCYAMDEEACAELDQIRQLRNTIAHGDDYADTRDTVQQFIAQLRCAEEWIVTLDSLLLSQQGTQ